MKTFRGPAQARGAALLMAMIIVALVATLASAMVWQQWRTVQIETAERARSQASWILTGALDWSMLILREDANADRRKTGKPAYDGLDEPWATPLAEARLSTFLAADENYTGDGPEAFLSGDISDAQGRFNVLNLVLKKDSEEDWQIDSTWVKALADLCESVGASRATATTLAEGLRDARNFGSANAKPNPPVMPGRIDQLAWFGIDPAVLKRLEPFLSIIEPRPGNGLMLGPDLPTPVNINTAPSEVIAAVLGINPGEAGRLVQLRKNDAWQNITEAANQARVPPEKQSGLEKRISIKSAFFEVRGRMRIGDRVLEQKALVYRDTSKIPAKTTVVTRQDTALKDLGT